MSETQTSPATPPAAPAPAPAASAASLALPFSEAVIFWGKVAGGITAIGALIAAVVLSIAKLAALHALVSGIPRMEDRLESMERKLDAVEAQTSPGTVSALIRSELLATRGVESPPVQVAQQAAPDRVRGLSAAVAAVPETTPNDPPPCASLYGSTYCRRP